MIPRHNHDFLKIRNVISNLRNVYRLHKQKNPVSLYKFYIYNKFTPNIYKSISNIPIRSMPNISMPDIHIPEIYKKNLLFPKKVDDLTVKMNEKNFQKMVHGIQVIGGQDIPNRYEITSFKVRGCSLPDEDRPRCNGNYTSFLIDFYNWQNENIYSLQMNGWRCEIVFSMKDRQVKIEIEYEEPLNDQQIKIGNETKNIKDYIENPLYIKLSKEMKNFVTEEKNKLLELLNYENEFVYFMFNIVISDEYNNKYSEKYFGEKLKDMEIIRQMIGLDRLFNVKNNKIRIQHEIQNKSIFSFFLRQGDRNKTKPIDSSLYLSNEKLHSKEEKQMNPTYFKKIFLLIDHSEIENFPKEEDITSLSFCKYAPSRVGSITNLLEVNDNKLYKIERTPFFMKNAPKNKRIIFQKNISNTESELTSSSNSVLTILQYV